MLSVVIPYYEVDKEKKELFEKCVKSLRGHDELVVVWNNGMGYAPAVNRGLMCAHGDFIVVMNDDVELVNGDLTMLCNNDAVVSPSFGEKTYPYIWGSCFCMPKWVYEKVGGMDERFESGYFEDDDLIMRLKEAGIPMKSTRDVVFAHKPGSTMYKLQDRDKIYRKNEERFIEKWGKLL